MKEPAEVRLPSGDRFLVFFAWKGREAAFCLPFLMIPLWIPANVLRSTVSSVERSELITIDFTHIVSCSIAWFTESLRSFDSFPFNPRLRAVQTSGYEAT
jgi:hypothetical protein